MQSLFFVFPHIRSGHKKGGESGDSPPFKNIHWDANSPPAFGVAVLFAESEDQAFFVAAFLAGAFLATFFALLAAFLAGAFLAGALVAAFFAAFLAGAFTAFLAGALAAFLATVFFATFFAAFLALLATFFAAFLAAFFAGAFLAGAFLAGAFLAGAFAAFFATFFTAAFLAGAFLAGAFVAAFFAVFAAAFFAVFFAAMALCRLSSRSMLVFSSGVKLPAERSARIASPRRPPKALVRKSCIARRTIVSCERRSAWHSWATPSWSSSTSRPRRSTRSAGTTCGRIIRAARARGASVILNSHLLGEVERVCDEVIIVHRGRAIAAGSLRALLGAPSLRVVVSGLPDPSGCCGAFAPVIVETDHLLLQPIEPDRAPDVVAGARRRGRPGPRRGARPALAGGPVPGAGPERRDGGDRVLPPAPAASSMSARAVTAICILTLREVARRRLLWILLGLSVVSVLLVGWVVTQLVDYARSGGMNEVRIGLGVSQVLVFVAFMFSFVLAMSAAFLAAPAIAGDVESGTLLAMLARPISRADLVLGRWIGLCIVTAAYAFASGVLAIGVVAQVSGYTPPDPVVAVGGLMGEAIATLTLALALGTRLPAIAAGSISVVCFGLSWFGGVLASAAGLLRAEALVPSMDGLRLVMPTDLLWRGVIHALEPPLVLLAARGIDPRAFASDPFFAIAPMSLGALGWTVAWTVGVLIAGVLAFGRREL